MYVNYFDRFVKSGEENPTVAILLCVKKRQRRENDFARKCKYLRIRVQSLFAR
jgi:hypothetical protein